MSHNNFPFRQTVRVMGLLLLAAALLACGSKSGTSSGGASGSSSGVASSAPGSNPRSGNASAEEVAEEMRGSVHCPAKVKSAARDAKAPVDDVLGVRPGMTYEEAANVVLCAHDLMVVQPDSQIGRAS